MSGQVVSNGASAERLAPARRLVDAALITLAIGVALGCVFFGAPPRFGTAHGAGEGLAWFLETLGPWFVVQLSICVAATLLTIDGLRHPRRTGTLRDAAWLPLGALLAMALVTLIPLPPALLGWVASFSAETYALVDDEGIWRPSTLWVAGTWNAAWTLTGMLTASIAVLRAARLDRDSGDPVRTARRILTFVALLAVGQCAYGFYETWFASDGYLGLSKLSGKGRVTGTFIHGTMLAVWAGMGACASLGLAGRRVVNRPGSISFPAVGWGAATLIVLAGAQFSLSRLGFLAAGIAVVFVLVRLSAALRASGAGVASSVCFATAVIAPVLGIATVLAVPRFRQRIHYVTDWLQGIDVPEEPRWAMWSTTWDLFSESPIVGTGLGSFGRAVHLVQHDVIPQELWFAHSDVLNLLSDAGIVGALLGAWWLLRLVRRGWSATRTDPSELRCLAVGALGAAFVVVIAATGDFQTQFAVVALPFAALLTLPAALVSDETARPMTKGHRMRLIALIVVLVLAGAAAVSAHVQRAVHRSAGLAPGATWAERAVLSGRSSLESRDPARLPSALHDFENAAAADPLLDRAHLWRAVALLTSERREEALLHLGRARHVSRGHTDVNLLVGQLYMRLIDTAPAPHGPDGDTALDALREAGALSPNAFAIAFQLGLDVQLSTEDMRRLVPDRAHAWIRFAEYLRRQDAEAADVREALERAVASEPRHAVARYRLARALLAGGDVDAARPHVLRALELEPQALSFHIQILRAYVGANLTSQGREVFAEAGVPFPEEGD